MSYTLLNFTDTPASTQLLSAITTSPASGTVETWSVQANSLMPAAPFEFAIDIATASEELCLCQTAQGNVWTVQRGFDASATYVHSVISDQIEPVVSAVVFAEANDHLTQDGTHPQYMSADGIGHDSPTYHSVGIGSEGFFSVQAGPLVGSSSHWGDQISTGQSLYPAAANHVHNRESLTEMIQGVWPVGVRALWSGITAPPGWVFCDGSDVRTDLAPQLFAQIGYTTGTAIDWYPPPPLLPSTVQTQNQTITDSYTNSTVVVSVPYVEMFDPRKMVMVLPEGSYTYFKVPNLITDPQIASGLRWIIKIDYGYQPYVRPSPPAARPLYVAPYAVDSAYPQASAVKASTTQVQSTLPVKPGTFKTGFSWTYDKLMGIPVITGTDFVSPGVQISGPILIPVYPFGSVLPSDAMVLPDQTLVSDLAGGVYTPQPPSIVSITAIPPPPVYVYYPPPPVYVNVSPPVYVPAPPPPPPAPVYVPPAASPPPPVVTPTPNVYTIVPGDNLWDIAERNGISLASLEAANSYIPAQTGTYNLIYPGMQIVIPS